MDWKSKTRVIHQTVVQKWQVWGDDDRHFLALALGGEVGELQNLIKKAWRGDQDPNFRSKLALEIADIRIYLELLAKAYEIDIDRACDMKTSELLLRWPAAKKAVEKAIEDEEEEDDILP